MAFLPRLERSADGSRDRIGPPLRSFGFDGGIFARDLRAIVAEDSE
jgi:hypothetical protein